MLPDPYVIWSFEHDAWWRPGRMGYTPHLAEAGHYTHAEADTIVALANRYTGRYPHEQALSLAVAQVSGRPPGLHRIGPGVYDDGDGGLHLDVAELLRHHGYTDTPANRATLIAAARDMAGGVPLNVVED